MRRTETISPLDKALVHTAAPRCSSAPVSITRIGVPAGYRTGRALASRLPLFWWRAWHELRRARPDVVHAHDLDTLPVGYAYSRLSGARLIYDAHEYYAGMVRANVGGRVGPPWTRWAG
jgi:hypothetical protein